MEQKPNSGCKSKKARPFKQNKRINIVLSIYSTLLLANFKLSRVIYCDDKGKYYFRLFQNWMIWYPWSCAWQIKEWLTTLQRVLENLLLFCSQRKLSCDSRFQRVFTACCCIFKAITLPWANQGNYSQTCVQRPPSGPQNIGRCWQRVVVQKSFMK